MFLEEQVLPLGPKTGASSMPPIPLEALHVRLFWQHLWEKWSGLTTTSPEMMVCMVDQTPKQANMSVFLTA